MVLCADGGAGFERCGGKFCAASSKLSWRGELQHALCLCGAGGKKGTFLLLSYCRDINILPSPSQTFKCSYITSHCTWGKIRMTPLADEIQAVTLACFSRVVPQSTA